MKTSSGILAPDGIADTHAKERTAIKKIKEGMIAPVGLWQRYLSYLRYGTVKKHYNLLRSLINWKTGATRISTMPSFLKVEITRECKVGCKFCFIEKPSWYYSFENYKKLVDKLKDYVYLVSLYDIGEPLESDDLIPCILYAKENNIGSVISTSLAVKKPDEFWEALALSGLDKIIVAIDGVTAEVYNKYRTNADFALVMENLKRLIYYKKKHKTNLFIEWQMVDFVWNKHEQDAGKALAAQMGCDHFRLIREVVKARLRYRKDNVIRTRNCMLPYIILVVTADNQVRPCYKIYHEPVEIGDMNKNSFEEIWNGEEVFKIRDKRKIGCRTGCKTCQE